MTSAPPGTRTRMHSAAARGRSNQCQHWPAVTTSKASVGAVDVLGPAHPVVDLDAFVL